MKDLRTAVAIFAVALLLIPLILALSGNDVNNSSYTYSSKDEAVKPDVKDITFEVRDCRSGAQSKVAGFDLICGVVAGEMPSEYDEQALEAQAVAAFSYCCYLREHSTGGAYIRIGMDVAYLPCGSAKKLWGADFERQWNKIEDAVRKVYGKALFYGGRVIEATYCDMSSGITESCKDVYGNTLPYLVEVASPGDKLEKDYLTHVTLTLRQFKAKVCASYPGASFYSGSRGGPEKFLANIKRSGAGGVNTATLCGESVTGRNIRGIFGLRSANFTLDYSGGKFTFAVRGYGHGVGMSQCGAEYMARQGVSWQNILKWYYKGAVIGNYIY